MVVTLKTLDGYPIDDYGYQLGRHWGIGEKGKNTGALLIVDADEHKLRIEVRLRPGRHAHRRCQQDIIRNTIAPKFKQEDFAGGIGDGVDTMIAVLGGQTDQPVPHPRKPMPWISSSSCCSWASSCCACSAPGLFYGRRCYRGGFWGGGFGGGGFGGGGGFSGGGGSFGGGGASGGW